SVWQGRGRRIPCGAARTRYQSGRPQTADSHQDRGDALLHGRSRTDPRRRWHPERRTGTLHTYATDYDVTAPNNRARHLGGAHRPPRARRESLAPTARGHWTRVSTQLDPPNYSPI